uniref:Selenoprotein K n=1 Tax=Loa loa TaxID=7209 RepID=A0A1I7W5V1_LOALO
MSPGVPINPGTPFSQRLDSFHTLFGPLIGDAGDRRPQRRNDWSGNNRWPGSGGPGGPPRGGHGYGTGRRPIGRPTFPSGMSCPPLGGGS